LLQSKTTKTMTTSTRDPSLLSRTVKNSHLSLVRRRDLALPEDKMVKVTSNSLNLAMKDGIRKALQTRRLRLSHKLIAKPIVRELNIFKDLTILVSKPSNRSRLKTARATKGDNLKANNNLKANQRDRSLRDNLKVRARASSLKVKIRASNHRVNSLRVNLKGRSLRVSRLKVKIRPSNLRAKTKASNLRDKIKASNLKDKTRVSNLRDKTRVSNLKVSSHRVSPRDKSLKDLREINLRVSLRISLLMVNSSSLRGNPPRVSKANSLLDNSLRVNPRVSSLRASNLKDNSLKDKSHKVNSLRVDNSLRVSKSKDSLKVKSLRDNSHRDRNLRVVSLRVLHPTTVLRSLPKERSRTRRIRRRRSTTANGKKARTKRRTRSPIGNPKSGMRKKMRTSIGMSMRKRTRKSLLSNLLLSSLLLNSLHPNS
jgi:hypothetical protein